MSNKNTETKTDTKQEQTLENNTESTEKAYVPTEEDVVFADGTVYKGANKKVTVLIPEEPGVKEQLPVYVNVNGRTALIQRGVPVEVHISIAKVLQESDRLRKVSDKYYTQVSE